MKLPQLFMLGIFMTIFQFLNAQNDVFNSDNFGVYTPEMVHSSAINYRVIAIAGEEYVEGSWVKEDSTSFTYSGENGSDEINNQYDFDENATFTWNEGEFLPVQLITRTYYSDSLVEEQLGQYYESGEWVSFYNYLFNYNEDDQLTTRTYQSLADGNWEDDSRVVYEYEGELLLTETQENWNEGSWQNDVRDVYSYNAEDYLESHIEQEWNGASWENNSKRTFEYDQNGNLIEEQYDAWTGTDWMPLYRDLMEYDNENWLVEEIEQTTAGGELPWQDGDKVLYSHNSGDFYYNEILYQNLVDGNYIDFEKSSFTFTEFNRVATSTYSMWDGSAWQDVDRSFLYYEEYDDGSVGIESNEDLGIEVYPNPATDYVLFKNSGETETMQVDVYNLNGQLVEKLSGSGEIRWNIDRSLPSGIYSYRITIGDSSQRGQIINS